MLETARVHMKDRIAILSAHGRRWYRSPGVEGMLSELEFAAGVDVLELAEEGEGSSEPSGANRRRVRISLIWGKLVKLACYPKTSSVRYHTTGLYRSLHLSNIQAKPPPNPPGPQRAAVELAPNCSQPQP